MHRLAIAIPIIILSTLDLQAQRALQGTFVQERPANGRVVLLGTRGMDHYPIDSAAIDTQGRFRFDTALLGNGFYQLAVNDSDRADVILSTAEANVAFQFTGLPLQDHLRVLISRENTLLWDHKLISREAQAVQVAARTQRMALSPTQVNEARSLDSLEEAANVMREADLERILITAPESYFAKVIVASQGVEKEMKNGPLAIARVFDFGDPALLRSSPYPKAVLLFLQSLNAVSESQFMNASDTLMHLASRDPDCRAYMLELLVEVFATYGPDLALQHVVDTYIAGHEAEIPAELLEGTRALRAVSIGAIGPDLELDGPGISRFRLSDVTQQADHTLLFFYSSTCDHCQEEMPGLVELYAKYHPRGLEVVGIALDTDTLEFETCIRVNGLPWRSTSSFNGWGSKAAEAYVVKATPSLILLDKERRIIAKPMDHVELRTKLQDLIP